MPKNRRPRDFAEKILNFKELKCIRIGIVVIGKNTGADIWAMYDRNLNLQFRAGGSHFVNWDNTAWQMGVSREEIEYLCLDRFHEVKALQLAYEMQIISAIELRLLKMDTTLIDTAVSICRANGLLGRIRDLQPLPGSERSGQSLFRRFKTACSDDVHVVKEAVARAAAYLEAFRGQLPQGFADRHVDWFVWRFCKRFVDDKGATLSLIKDEPLSKFATDFRIARTPQKLMGQRTVIKFKDLADLKHLSRLASANVNQRPVPSTEYTAYSEEVATALIADWPAEYQAPLLNDDGRPVYRRDDTWSRVMKQIFHSEDSLDRDVPELPTQVHSLIHKFPTPSSQNMDLAADYSDLLETLGPHKRSHGVVVALTNRLYEYIVAGDRVKAQWMRDHIERLDRLGDLDPPEVAEDAPGDGAGEGADDEEE